MVKQAPVTFIVLALVALGAGGYGGWLLPDKQSSERIGYLEQANADYRANAGATPEDAAQRIKKLEATVDSLSAPPKLLHYEAEWEAQPDGVWKYLKRVHVSSRYVPEGLMLKIKKTDAVIDWTVQGLSDPGFLIKAQPMTEEDGWHRLYLRQPHGIYEIVVRMKSKIPAEIEGTF